MSEPPDVVAAFDADAIGWDGAYDAPGFRGDWRRSRLAAALELLGAGPGDVLDAGMGPGRLLEELERRGWTVWGVDASPRMVNLARGRVPAARERILEGRLENLPFADGTFDAVFSYSVLQHFSKPDVRQTLGECARVLTSTGFSLIQMANALGLRSLFHQARRRFREPKLFEVRYWTPRELRDAFTAIVGPSTISIDGFLSLNAQPEEARLLPARFRMIVRLSEALRAIGTWAPPLGTFADSLYVESRRKQAG